MSENTTEKKIHSFPAFHSADFVGQDSKSIQTILDQKLYPALSIMLLKHFLEDPEMLKVSKSPMERRINGIIDVLQQMGSMMIATKKNQEIMSENQLKTIVHLGDVVSNIVELKAKAEVGASAKLVEEGGEVRITNNIGEANLMSSNIEDRLNQMEEKVNSIHDMLQTIVSGNVALVTSGMNESAASYSNFDNSKSMQEILSEESNRFDPSMFDMGASDEGLEELEDFSLDLASLDIVREMTGK